MARGGLGLLLGLRSQGLLGRLTLLFFFGPLSLPWKSFYGAAANLGGHRRDAALYGGLTGIQDSAPSWLISAQPLTLAGLLLAAALGRRRSGG